MSYLGQDLFLGLTLNSACSDVAAKVIDNEAAPLPPGSGDALLSQLTAPQHNKQEIHLHVI